MASHKLKVRTNQSLIIKSTTEEVRHNQHNTYRQNDLKEKKRSPETRRKVSLMS